MFASYNICMLVNTVIKYHKKKITYPFNRVAVYSTNIFKKTVYLALNKSSNNSTVNGNTVSARTTFILYFHFIIFILSKKISTASTAIEKAAVDAAA
jgi:hypothetical protein